MNWLLQKQRERILFLLAQKKVMWSFTKMCKVDLFLAIPLHMFLVKSNIRSSFSWVKTDTVSSYTGLLMYSTNGYITYPSKVTGCNPRQLYCK